MPHSHLAYVGVKSNLLLGSFIKACTSFLLAPLLFR